MLLWISVYSPMLNKLLHSGKNMESAYVYIINCTLYEYYVGRYPLSAVYFTCMMVL